MAFFFDENFLQLFSNTCRCKSFKVSTNGWNGMLDNFLFYDTVMSFATTAGLPAWCKPIAPISFGDVCGGFARARAPEIDIRRVYHTMSSNGDDVVCQVCKKDEDDEYLVLCDGCDRAYHTFCFSGCDCCGEKPKGQFGRIPPVPTGDWFCKHCVDQPETANGSNKKNAKRSVYGWGLNDSGQLGIGKCNENNNVVRVPQQIESLQALSICTMSCGMDFTIVCCEGGNAVYSVGSGYSGKLGHPDIVHENLTTFRRIQALDPEKRPKSDGPVTNIVSGKDFTLALTKNGSMYSFGCGEVGQLGHQENKNRKVPKKISALRQMELEIDLRKTLAWKEHRHMS